jgi:hypothetical protein
MATRYGYRTLQWLLKRGWEAAPLPKEFICGDQHVIHPHTKKEITVYEAAEIQRSETGEYPEFLDVSSHRGRP